MTGPTLWERRRNEFWIALAGIGTIAAAVIAYVALTDNEEDPPKLTVTCIRQGEVAPGARLQLTYTITSDRDVHVGVAAGFYDQDGTDHDTGTGNIDDKPLEAGTTVVSRVFVVPTGLPPGVYEIGAEIWPANQIGEDGVDTWAEAPCGDPVTLA